MNQRKSKMSGRLVIEARRPSSTSRPDHAFSNSARSMSRPRGSVGRCTSSLLSINRLAMTNAPCRSSTIAGSGVFARRSHFVATIRDLRPSCLAMRTISSAEAPEEPARWRRASSPGSAGTPKNRAIRQRLTSPVSTAFGWTAADLPPSCDSRGISRLNICRVKSRVVFLDKLDQSSRSYAKIPSTQVTR